ncbi:type I restriction endonuclease, partial [Candidatus Corynebacterium faecigallinarum]
MERREGGAVIAPHLDEASLESLIVTQMVEEGWSEGRAPDFDPSYALDLEHLTAFVEATQPHVAEALSLGEPALARHRFLARLQGEITKRGVVDILRDGVDHLGQHVDLYYPQPSAGNTKATKLFAANHFVITRQVHHSPSNRGDAVDLVAFVNGIPVFTFEL